MDGVEDLGVVVDAERSDHLALVLLVLFLVFDLRGAGTRRSMSRSMP